MQLRVAHALTGAASGTYEAGTERVEQREALRAFNELQQRVVGTAMHGLVGSEVPALTAAMMRDLLAGTANPGKRLGDVLPSRLPVA